MLYASFAQRVPARRDANLQTSLTSPAAGKEAWRAWSRLTRRMASLSSRTSSSKTSWGTCTEPSQPDK